MKQHASSFWLWADAYTCSDGRASDRREIMDFRQLVDGQRRRRVLVEECDAFAIGVLRACLGVEALRQAIRDCQPLVVPLSYRLPATLWVADAPNRVPHRRVQTVRFWLICPGCRKAKGKLLLLPNSVQLAPKEPQCRNCLGLTYQSVNCGKNRWWREIARPLKRLLRQRDRIGGGRLGPTAQGQLAVIDAEIARLRSRVGSIYRAPPTRERQKRRYRDLSLIG